MNRYICEIYGKEIEKINEVKTQIFLDKYRRKNENERLSCVTNLDASMLPPCEKVLQQKLKRVQLIARRWASLEELVGSLKTAPKNSLV